MHQTDFVSGYKKQLLAGMHKSSKTCLRNLYGRHTNIHTYIISHLKFVQKAFSNLNSVGKLKFLVIDRRTNSNHLMKNLLLLNNLRHKCNHHHNTSKTFTLFYRIPFCLYTYVYYVYHVNMHMPIYMDWGPSFLFTHLLSLFSRIQLFFYSDGLVLTKSLGAATWTLLVDKIHVQNTKSEK